MGLYPLWDVESGNRTEEYATLAAALAAVRDDTAQLGRQYAETYALFQETSDQPCLVAEGTELVELAVRTTPTHPSSRAS